MVDQKSGVGVPAEYVYKQIPVDLGGVVCNADVSSDAEILNCLKAAVEWQKEMTIMLDEVSGSTKGSRVGCHLDIQVQDNYAYYIAICRGGYGNATHALEAIEWRASAPPETPAKAHSVGGGQPAPQKGGGCSIAGGIVGGSSGEANDLIAKFVSFVKGIFS